MGYNSSLDKVKVNMNYYIAGLFVLSVLFFLFMPQLDLEIAKLFWKDGLFYLKDHPLMVFLYKLVNVATPIMILGGLAYIAYQLITKKIHPKYSPKNLFYILAVGVIGSMVMVNLVFKDNWGRARPSQIIEFDGSKNYTPPLQPASECDNNCSFVCGHASFGFFFLSLYFLYKRKAYFYFALFLGSAIGFARMAQGGHFFGDVVFSFFVMYATAYALHRLMYKEEYKTT